MSIIVPCYNEAKSIVLLLEAVRRQTYPLPQIEVVIADGGSTDGTQGVIGDYSAEHPELRLRLVNNPKRSIPAGLNTAIAQAEGQVIIRLDAHSQPNPEYIERCLETLDRIQAANVGGIWEIHPPTGTAIARSIAAAAAHPLGAGDARYRIHGPEGPVDTVPFGAYRRSWLAKVGGFREDLHSNEDYELNWRLRSLGGTVWLNPAIRSVYFSRGTLLELARQYARYGFWKARMLLLHPRSLRWRQVVPPLFALSSLSLLVVSTVLARPRTLLAVESIGYGLALTFAGLWKAVEKRDPALAFGLPLALFTIHLSWGGAFWWGLLTGLAGGKLGSKRP